MSTHHVQQAWLTVQDAAGYCGLSVRTIQTLIKEQQLVSSAVTRPGKDRGRRLVERASLEAWIAKGVPSPAIADAQTGGEQARTEEGATLPSLQEGTEAGQPTEGGAA